MKKRRVLPLILAAISATLTVLSFLLLPPTVITQLAAVHERATTMPRSLAVCIPSLLGLGGAFAAFFSNNNRKCNCRYLTVSGTGIAMLVLTLLVNLSL